MEPDYRKIVAYVDGKRPRIKRRDVSTRDSRYEEKSIWAKQPSPKRK